MCGCGKVGLYHLSSMPSKTSDRRKSCDLTHWQTEPLRYTQTLLRKHFHKFETDFFLCTCVTVRGCVCMQTKPRGRRLSTARSICGKPGLRGYCNPNSSPYAHTTTTINHLSHLTGTEILF